MKSRQTIVCAAARASRGLAVFGRRSMKGGLLKDFKAGFFDDRVGQNVLRNTADLFFRLVARQALDVQYEEFSLPNVFDGRVAQTGKSVLDGLALRIEYSALRHHPNMCFHVASITLRQRGSVDETVPPVRGAHRLEARRCKKGPQGELLARGEERMFEAGGRQLSELRFCQAHVGSVFVFGKQGGLKHGGIVR